MASQPFSDLTFQSRWLVGCYTGSSLAEMPRDCRLVVFASLFLLLTALLAIAAVRERSWAPDVTCLHFTKATQVETGAVTAHAAVATETGAMTTHAAAAMETGAVQTKHAMAATETGAVSHSLVLKNDTGSALQPSKYDFWYAKRTGEWRRPFLVRQHKLVFCAIPKVGTYGWLRLLRWLDGQKDWDQVPYDVQVKGQIANLTKLQSMSQQEAEAILFDHSWTKIAVVRDPLDRLVSSYSDKLTKISTKGTSLLKSLDLSDQIFLNTSFEDFVTRVGRTVIDNTEFENEHWIRQSRACGLEHFYEHYHYIFYMPPDKQKYEQLTAAVLETIKERSPKRSTILNFSETERSAKGHPSNHASAIMTQNACKKALRLYAQDYELFGMPRPVCLPDFPYVQWPN